MKTKIDIKKVCECYNIARTQNSGRKGGTQWIIDILKSCGLSNNMAKRIIHEPTLITTYKNGNGNSKGYIFPTTPVHITWFEKWLSNKPKISIKKDPNFESECAIYLKQQGYKLKRLVGFDENTFKKDYPQIYEKYLIYEEV